MEFADMNRIAWIAFAAMLLFAIVYFAATTPNLPPLVASHFDGSGYPTAYMTRNFYTKFVFFMGVGLPIALVALLSLIYSRASDMKMPNRDYWLAPERIALTRALLVAHGVCFGCLMVAMVCYVHWLEMNAHQTMPPHLSGRLVSAGLFVFFLVTGGWIIAMLRYFRRPRLTTS
jgi:uncharacterized membrane protein